MTDKESGENTSQKNQINSNRPVRRIEECNSKRKLKCEHCSKEISKAKANSNQDIQAQSARGAHRCDKKFEDLVEEVNTKRRLGYKIIEDSDRPNKQKVLYQQTVHLLEEKNPSNCSFETSLHPSSFNEEHLKKAKRCKSNMDYHCFAYKSNGTQPAMNAEQSNAAQAVNDSEINKNFPTDNPVAQTVQNGATASGQDTKTFSETSSAKQRREERTKKFEIELETKMQLEQARFELRWRKWEMQLKELETKHQVLEEDRELERKVKKKALENDDVPSQSTSARDKSPFNWAPKKRNVSDWVSKIDQFLTPDRSTNRFEVTPEVNRHTNITRYRSSRDRSLPSVEDRDVSPRVVLRYNSGFLGISNLPELKLNDFDGNPLEWPEWSSMFVATVDQRPIPDS